VDCQAAFAPTCSQISGIFLFVVLNTASTLRYLGTLKQLEDRGGEDEITLALFDGTLFIVT
jgi:hypothetical protein